MSSPQIERKLAAIMFTDIAGYTALSAKDENKALELLDTQKQILTPIIEEFNGTLHKEMGDGLLFTFPTVTEAVKCGIKIQEDTKANDDLNLRVGIHEGEITLKDGDALGDDVNVASRIEAFAPSGGIAISSKVQQNISSLPEFETSYVGKPELKGVAQKVEVYCITSHGLPKADEIVEPTIIESKSNFNIFALTGGILTAIGIAFWIAVGVFDVSFGGKAEVPSVGILMMKNLGSEDEEFWSSGMTADLITKVAGAGLIRVSPLDDILKLDKELSIEEKAMKLRVKYILTHSFLIKDDEFDLWCKLENIETGVALFSNKISEPMDMTTQMVGKLANDIVTSLKVQTKQDVMTSPTSNSEAYEYYLKGKYMYENLKNMEELEISRGLLEKSIKLDNNLLESRIQLGRTYLGIGANTFIPNKMINNNKAKDIFNNVLATAEKNGDKFWIGRALRNIGIIFFNKEDSIALNYYNRSLEIANSIGDKEGMSLNINNIAVYYQDKAEYDKAIEYHNRAFIIRDKLGDENAMASSAGALSYCYSIQGKYDKALEYILIQNNIYNEIGEEYGLVNSLLGRALIYDKIGVIDSTLHYLKRSLNISEINGYKDVIAVMLGEIGELYFETGDYEQAIDHYTQSIRVLKNVVNIEKIDKIAAEASMLNSLAKVYLYSNNLDKTIEYLEKSFVIQKEIELKEIEFETTTYLYLTYKHSGKEYDAEKIRSLIKESEITIGAIADRDWTLKDSKIELNYAFFQLLEDTSYLEAAYNQVQENASAMDEEFSNKFLSYPIPKAIVEEWEKVK